MGAADDDYNLCGYHRMPRRVQERGVLPTLHIRTPISGGEHGHSGDNKHHSHAAGTEMRSHHRKQSGTTGNAHGGGDRSISYTRATGIHANPVRHEGATTTIVVAVLVPGGKHATLEVTLNGRKTAAVRTTEAHLRGVQCRHQRHLRTNRNRVAGLNGEHMRGTKHQVPN